MLKLILAISSILFSFNLIANERSASPIKPFASDGCSLFPEGDLQNSKLWCSCCLVHDLRYWIGGSKNKRKNADLELKECVYQKTNNAALAQTMYLGVRTGGKPHFPTWYRWGYGYDYGRGYKEPSLDEWMDIKEQIAGYQLTNHSFEVCKEYIPAPTDLISVLLSDRSLFVK